MRKGCLTAPFLNSDPTAASAFGCQRLLAACAAIRSPAQPDRRQVAAGEGESAQPADAGEQDHGLRWHPRHVPNPHAAAPPLPVAVWPAAPSAADLARSRCGCVRQYTARRESTRPSRRRSAGAGRRWRQGRRTAAPRRVPHNPAPSARRRCRASAPSAPAERARRASR